MEKVDYGEQFSVHLQEELQKNTISAALSVSIRKHCPDFVKELLKQLEMQLPHNENQIKLCCLWHYKFFLMIFHFHIFLMKIWKVSTKK